MAVRFKVDHQRSNVYNFLPQDIIVKPGLNGRHDTPDITAMKESIVAQGQLQPVLVRSENNRPVLCAGFSRWRAISELNLERKDEPPIKIAAIYVRLNEQDGFLANWTENRARNDTTPMDDAYQFAMLLKWNWTESEIAEKLELKVAFVKSRLALAEADPSVQDAVSKGRVKPTAAAKIAKLSAKQQQDIVAREGKITAQSVSTVTGKPRKATMKQLRETIEETADTTNIEAVHEFALKLLAKMDGTDASS